LQERFLTVICARPFGFTGWMAGGVQGLLVHGATGEYGWDAV
jgi:hypothetical protein